MMVILSTNTFNQHIQQLLYIYNYDQHHIKQIQIGNPVQMMTNNKSNNGMPLFPNLNMLNNSNQPPNTNNDNNGNSKNNKLNFPMFNINNNNTSNQQNNTNNNNKLSNLIQTLMKYNYE